jgi:GTPase SAR1 family protein
MAKVKVQRLSCRNPDCTLPQGGVCALAEEHGFANPREECPELIRESEPSPSPATPDATPWRGRHLSEVEADRMMQTSPARVLGLVGPYSSGKTCLVASLFLQLADGQTGVLDYRFASSRSLHALQTMCREIGEWDGQAAGQIVTHTPKSEESDTGVGNFIHLGLRPCSASDDRHVDLLLGDIAGEHFSEHAAVLDAKTTRQLAFLDRCDGFLLVIDSVELFGAKGRKLDADLGRMAQRLLDLDHDAPIAFVLTKVDVLDEPLQHEAELRRHFERKATHLVAAMRRARESGRACELFATAAIPAAGQPRGVQEVFRYLMSHADRRARWPSWMLPIPETPTSAFSAMRRWRDAP